MYFLLPSREAADPVINEFQKSISHKSTFNYQNDPLYTFFDSKLGKTILMTANKPEEKSEPLNKGKATKTIIRSAEGRPLNAASKTIHRVTEPAPRGYNNEFLECNICKWTFPRVFHSDDAKLHIKRCFNKLGKLDVQYWEVECAQRNLELYR